MSNKKNWAVVTAVVIASAIASGVWLLRDSAAQGGGAWPNPKVALSSVVRSQAPRTLHGVGELEAARQVALASEVAGRIVRIAFDSGQPVRRGDLLVQINDAPEQAERLRLRAQLRNAETTLARTRKLLAEKVATREQWENAVAARDMAAGELRRIEAVIDQKALRAPFDGVAGIRRVHEGQYLQPGEAIVSLIDTQGLKVNFSLDELAAPHLHVGQPVQLRLDAWPQEVFPATLSAIDPWVGKARTLQVQARLDAADPRLRAGMFANVQVKPPQPVSVLTVPETAVTYTAYGQTVFVARTEGDQPPTVHRVAVKTGERWQGLVEILQGLNEGDRVVVSGQIKLSDGMPIDVAARDALHEAPTGAAQEQAS